MGMARGAGLRPEQFRLKAISHGDMTIHVHCAANPGVRIAAALCDALRNTGNRSKEQHMHAERRLPSALTVRNKE